MLIPITGPILDSSGRPADGWLTVRASAPFDAAEGHITRAHSLVSVQDGVPTVAGAPWSLPPTPEGVWFVITQDLDGDLLQQFRVIVPDGPGTITYSALLTNRGEGVSGWEPFMWDLSGGEDFPEVAHEGDWGIDYATPGTIAFFKKGQDR